MENKKEGYTEVVIPEQRYNICDGCKYQKVNIGRFNNFQSVYYCNFNNIDFGSLNEINNQILTPDWCPFLNK